MDKNNLKIEDTFELMISSDYKERLAGEYWQLRIRIEKLEKVINDYDEKKFGRYNFELLYKQYIYMQRYLEAIEQRASLNNIDLYSYI